MTQRWYTILSHRSQLCMVVCARPCTSGEIRKGHADVVCDTHEAERPRCQQRSRVVHVHIRRCALQHALYQALCQGMDFALQAFAPCRRIEATGGARIQSIPRCPPLAARCPERTTQLPLSACILKERSGLKIRFVSCTVVLLHMYGILKKGLRCVTAVPCMAGRIHCTSIRHG
eukprot:COSAG01_NODE_7175_length_3318_cov_17.992855_2_plen_174_part_00